MSLAGLACSAALQQIFDPRLNVTREQMSALTKMHQFLSTKMRVRMHGFKDWVNQ